MTNVSTTATPAPPIGPAIARTEQGLIQGVDRGGIKMFMGIRYAAAPAGDLRWRPPQPPTSWDGVKLADRFGPICPQRWLPLGPPGWEKEPQDEDCLSLNVWTAAKSTEERRPVMVWIHGGAYEIGSGSTPGYHGDTFAHAGVVLVTINYRLGTLGFLAHPDLTAESPSGASGNYGLMDMIAALRWVKANIAGFGGDPDNVTIFGESAGGGAVMLLSASPPARGLFHKAIAESGAALLPRSRGYADPDSVVTLAEAEAAGTRFSAQFGTADIEALRQVPASEIVEKQMRGTTWPIIDGEMVRADVTALYRAGQQHDVPILIGWNDNEGALFAQQPITREDYEARTRHTWGPAAETMLALHPAADDETARRASGELMADVAFAYSGWSLAEAQRGTGSSPVYLYHFTHEPPRPAEWPFGAARGALHADEIGYVFGHSTPEWQEADHRTSELMMNYWINFAKEGDPNGPGMPEWPAYAGDGTVQWIGDGRAVPGNVPRLEALQAIERVVGG